MYKIAKYFFSDKSVAETKLSKLDKESFFKEVVTSENLDENGNDLGGLLVDVVYDGLNEPSYMTEFRIEPNEDYKINIIGLDYENYKYDK